MCADVIEALLGLVYTVHGFESATKFSFFIIDNYPLHAYSFLATSVPNCYYLLFLHCFL